MQLTSASHTQQEAHRKRNQIVPYLPPYASNGNTVVSKRQEPFKDRRGNEAALTIVTYRDKKGVLHESVAQVKWV